MRRKKVVRKKVAKKTAATKKAPAKKKKMSKKEAAEHWSKGNIRKAVSGVLKGLTSDLRREYGSSRIAVAGGFSELLLGIPIPFPLEYLLDVSMLPLGTYMPLIVGKYGCNKSAFIAELIRLFGKQSGEALFIENESKFSPYFFDSIIGWPKEEEERFWASISADSVERWQKILQTAAGRTRDAMVKKTPESPYPPGRVWPFLLCLDSVMGKLSQLSQDNIEDDGAASRSTSAHGYEANIITQFFKKFPQDLEEWPFLFVCTNHVKEKQERRGSFSVKERSKAGGSHMDFQESWEIELSKGGSNKHLDKFNTDGGFDIDSNTVNFRCYKNSLGTTGRKLQCDIVWWNKRCDDGVVRQHTVWDWHSCTTKLLMSFDGERSKRVKEIVNIQKQKGDLYHCAQLGIPKSSPVDAADIGAAVANNIEIREALRDMFGISRIHQFEVGRDYMLQRAEREKAFEMRMQQGNAR